MDGFLNILKPPGMTSHDVVNFVRKITRIRKIGHTGTLDPEAAGVLPVCIGKATRSVQYVQDNKKIYRANITFGVETDTQDKYGKIINRTKVNDINADCLEIVTKKFVGKTCQVPSIYSAIKYKGKSLYKYAYEGIDIQIKSREIEIYDICIVDKLSKNEFILDIECSKGTYIRTLCSDIGKELGCGAHMSQLVRLESFPFKIDEAITIEEIVIASKNNNLENHIINIENVLTSFKKVSIDKKGRQYALNGNPLYTPIIIDNIQLFGVRTMLKIYIDDEFIGVGEIKYDEKHNNNYIKIKTLFV